MTGHVKLIADNLDGASDNIKLIRAKRILDALAAKGLVIVLREPTEAMVDAGWEPFPREDLGEDDDEPMPPTPSAIYRAMIAAGGDDG